MSERQHTILIVEDNELVADFTKINFMSFGCEVDIALDGKTALEYTKEKHYDLILIDIGLPDMKGYDLAKAIRLNGFHDNASVPIIALTAHAANEELERCIEAGMLAVIIKPLLQEKTKSLLCNYVWLRADAGNSRKVS